MTGEERNALLSMSDDELISLCRVDTFRASGRGGQKVNKTSSGIRVTHKTSGTAAESTGYRSQALNRHEALKRLKTAIALKTRCIPDGKFSLGNGVTLPSQNSGARALFRAQILDVVEENGFDFVSAAEKLNCTRSFLTKLFEHDAILMRHLREQRPKKTPIPPTQSL